ncbi:VOC family protein [Streptomyces tateyamensis]|uniref:VOC family protein n=1 Tax=Streptomyces tateyamensis TaxID=565073 RepID=UPI0015E8A83B|nr:VOC family protein [Streptomyces tateyamensis]
MTKAELDAVLVAADDEVRLAEFWAAALGWHPDAEGVLRPPAPGGPGLRFTRAAGPKRGKNRLHLDLAGGTDLDARVAGLRALGAEPIDIGQGAVPWRVLADPEGNEFCVLPVPDTGGPLAQLCQDAADPARQGAFWAAATGWQVVELTSHVARLSSPSGAGPTLVMGPPVAPKAGPARWRFQLTGEGGELLDPEGNEYQAGPLRGQPAPRTARSEGSPA